MSARRLKRAVIKEEFVDLTGNHIAALILNQMLYWTERVDDFDKFLLETQLRQRNIDIELQSGWIYKNAKELSEELMIGLSHQSIRRYMQSLIDAGYLQERNNPINGWDRTMQYRVDIVAIIKALDKLGYTLEGYAKLQPAIVHGGQSIVQNGLSSLSKMDNGTSKMDAVPYITEITTETTTKRERAKSKPDSQPPTPTPPATPVNGVRKMGNSEYDHPLSQSAPPSPPVAAAPSSRPAKSPHFDGRKFKGGRIPVGTGTNAVEVFYERHNINETKLSAPKEDDLIKAVTDLARWRDVVIAWHQSDYKPTNIKGQLDWYRDGIPERNGNGNAGNGTGFGLTAYAEKERKQHERNYGPDEELTPEKEQWIWEQKRKLAAQNSGV